MVQPTHAKKMTSATTSRPGVKKSVPVPSQAPGPGVHLRATKSETKLFLTKSKSGADKKLKTSSTKLLNKYPDRYSELERYSLVDGGTQAGATSLPVKLSGSSSSKVAIPKLLPTVRASQSETKIKTIPISVSAALVASIRRNSEPVEVKQQALTKKPTPNTIKSETMKQLSLIEQKKLQWAKEKEEQNGLFSPWGRPSTSLGPQHTGVVAYEELNEISRTKRHTEQITTINEYPRQRHSDYNSSTSKLYNYNYYNEDDHTSGYQSDGGGGSRHNSGDGVGGRGRQDEPDDNERMTRSYDFNSNKQLPAPAMRSSFAIGTGISDSGYIDEMKEKERAQWLHDLKIQMAEQNQKKDTERSRWGDKGICAGHFVEPDLLLPNSAESNPPAWAQRPLTSLSQSQSHPSLLQVPSNYSYSGRAANEHLVYTMNQSVGDLRNSAGSPNESNTFLRGQNVPIDPEVLKEHERKRIAAMQHQQAILQQIEERQQRLKEERERLARQEALDEQRIREQELKLLERAEMEKRFKEQLQQENAEEIHDFSLQSTPIVTLNRRSQFRPQNSEDFIEYQHVRNLTSECVQTDAVELLPKSPHREIGIQTELEKPSPGKGSGSSSRGQKHKIVEQKPRSSDSEEKKKEKPRWGAGGDSKKPYIKQSQKDPLYQERMNRITNKRKNWLNEKAEEKVHVAASTSYESDYSSNGRRLSKAPPSRTRVDQQKRTSRVDAKTRNIEEAKLLERQKQQWKQQQLEQSNKIDPEDEEEKNAVILRRQSQYLDEIDTEYLEKVVLSRRGRKASIPVELEAASERRRSSKSRSPTKIPVNINRRRQSMIDLSTSISESTDLQEEPQLKAPPPRIEQTRTKKAPPPKSTTVKKSKSTTNINSRSSSHTSRFASDSHHERVESASPLNDGPPPPRSQSPPVPALMKHIQMGVNPEEFGKMSLTYEIPEKATIDSTPPAPVTVAPTSATRSRPRPVPNNKPPSAAATRIEVAPPTPENTEFVQVQQEVQAKPRRNSTKAPAPSPPSSPPEESERLTTTIRYRQPLSVVQDEAEESEPSPPPTASSEVEYPKEDADAGYYTSYIPPPISPRYFLDTGPMPLSGRPSTRDSEFSERRRLITNLMNHGEVQEQLSAREDELSQNGIIEFSIHLPQLYNNGDLIVSTQYDGQEKVLHCSQPSSVSPSDAGDYVGAGTSRSMMAMAPYTDPLGSARRQATIRWLYSNDVRTDPYVLTRLSSLKRGIQRQQVEWNSTPLQDYEYEYDRDHRRRHAAPSHGDSLLLDYEN